MSLEKLKQPKDFDFGDANIQKLTKRDVLKTFDEISLAALAKDDRNFMNISENGAVCRALLDTGATLSLAGPGLAHRCPDRLLETSMRVRTAGSGTKSCLAGPDSSFKRFLA